MYLVLNLYRQEQLHTYTVRSCKINKIIIREQTIGGKDYENGHSLQSMQLTVGQ